MLGFKERTGEKNRSSRNENVKMNMWINKKGHDIEWLYTCKDDRNLMWFGYIQRRATETTGEQSISQGL